MFVEVLLVAVLPVAFIVVLLVAVAFIVVLLIEVLLVALRCMYGSVDGSACGCFDGLDC